MRITINVVYYSWKRCFPTFFLCFSILLGIFFCFGQKRPIGLQSLGNWPMVGMTKISSDGQYVYYYVDSINGHRISSSTLFLKSLKSNWKLEIPNTVYGAEFLIDDQHVIVPLKGDSLLLIKLGSIILQRIPDVQSYKICGTWLAYHHKGGSKVLSLLNVKKNVVTDFPSVIDYHFNAVNRSLLLHCKEADSVETIKWISFLDLRQKNIWQGAGGGSFLFDLKGIQLVFTVNKKVGSELWLYIAGKDQAKKIDFESPPSGAYNLAFQDFSQDGKRLFITFSKEFADKPGNPQSKLVHIWKSTDAMLYPQQLKEGKTSETYTAVIDLGTGKLTSLQQSQEKVIASNDDFLLLARRQGNADLLERNWSPSLKQKFYLVSTKDGSRRILPFEDGPCLLSPEGKYVLHYNAAQRNYFCYDIAADNIYNLTKDIVTPWTYSNDNVDSAGAINTLEIKWLKGDRGIVINDRFDIWLFDPLGQTAPVNVTNGFGKKNGICFHISLSTVEKILDKNQRLLLTGFNSLTKENGFFWKVLDQHGDPVRLTMGPFIYFVPFENMIDNGMMPIKAKKAEAYIVKRMDATNSPNYFFTKDFISFTPISDIYPEKEYNWLEVELKEWIGLDGIGLQGVLYKPENFNPSVSYPVILYYYEKLSNNLHVYQSPQLATGTINIPYLVSNGYLVFSPDIRYKVGYPGESAANAVVSAARFLKKLAYIDSTKIGIQGHSFGGFETNYIVTHTNMFAAACSAAGCSNLISHYGSLNGAGASMQGKSEIGQYRMGGSLWEKPDLYIANSPIFNVDKVTTPLLLNNNKEDNAVRFSQGVEFFTALRRLGKRAWLIEYENEGHVINNERAALDYTKKLKEFFDFYLKGGPQPDWMAQ